MNNSHTSTLFHYTKKKAALVSILKNGLYFAYSKESFFNNGAVGIPMVSFCDIPISRSAEHKSKYGAYALGLSQKYMIDNFQNGLNPVNYVLTDKQIRVAFKLHYKYIDNEVFLDNENKKSSNPISANFLGALWVGRGLDLNNELDRNIMKVFAENLSLNEDANSSLGYMKPYSILRKGKTQLNYDECEWRLVLPENAKLDKDIRCKWIWENYDEWRSLHKDKFVVNAPSIPFSVSDINYILVPKDNDIQGLINDIQKLKMICYNTITTIDKQSLISKIISFEKIIKDF